jgi:hypothetical protein
VKLSRRRESRNSPAISVMLVAPGSCVMTLYQLLT